MRRLNDRLRREHVGGKIIATDGVAAKGAAFITALDAALARHSFDLDPNDMHDFGVVVVDDERVVFKIDCFDLAGRHASPEATDDSATLRVLTLMLAEEY